MTWSYVTCKDSPDYLVRRYGPWYPVRCGDPGMTGCLECLLTRLVLAQSWSQTVLTEPGTRQQLT